MLPTLDGLSARNWGRDNAAIIQEILIISLAITEAATNFDLAVTVQYDTTVTINGTVITGSSMTNDDATGLTYYNAWQEVTTNAKLTEQMDTVIKYFEGYNYAITRTSSNGSSITWNLSW
jgi:hypothetical protein